MSDLISTWSVQLNEIFHLFFECEDKAIGISFIMEGISDKIIFQISPCAGADLGFFNWGLGATDP